MRQLVFVVTFSLAFAAAAESQNLVINGSFEQPMHSAGFFLGAIPGWTVSGANGLAEIQRDLSGISSAEGNQWVEFPLRDRRVKPVTEKKVVKTFRLSPRALERLHEMARERGSSETSVIENLLLGATSE